MIAVSPAKNASEQLRVSATPYGREPASQQLARMLGRVVATGVPRIALVSGPAGIGKTTLARTVESPVTRMHGLFVSGTFPPGDLAPPYSAIVQALDDVVPAILAEGAEGIRIWAQRLSEALGALGQLVVELVPALETLIGTPPAVPHLPLSEARARFNLVLRRFVHALAKRGHVLALVLDDLERADPESLALVEHLVTHAETGPLLVIATYRNDVAPTDAFRAFLDAIHGAGEEIPLAPLAIEDIAELCADALASSLDHTTPLALLIRDATGGNPLSVHQLIAELQRDGKLRFDPDSRVWTWNVIEIREASASGALVARALLPVSYLNGRARELVEVAACFGERFDVRDVALVAGLSVDETRDKLDEAVGLGLITTDGFVHARIREAIYAAIPDERRIALHLRIGRLLLDGLPPTRVFEVAAQLARGVSGVDNGERERIAHLELRAGRAAAASNAFAAAERFLAAGTRLLGADPWRDHYELALGLCVETARCALAQQHVDDSLRLIDDVCSHARERDGGLDRLRIEAHLARNEAREALQVAIESLTARGLDMRSAGVDRAAAEGAVWDAIAGRSIESLEALPILTDPGVEEALEILATMLSPAYLTDPLLHWRVACEMVVLSIRHGLTGVSATGFAALAMELVASARIDEGRRFAALALRLLARQGFAAEAGKTLLVLATFVTPRLEPLSRAVDYLGGGREAALAVGDIVFAGFNSVQLVAARLIRGDRLDDVKAQARSFIDVPDYPSYGAVGTVLRSDVAFIEAQQGDSAELDTAAFLQAPEMAIPLIVVWLHIRKLEALCLRGEHARAVEHADAAAPILWATRGQPCCVEYHLFAGLSRAAVGRGLPPGERAEVLRRLDEHEQALSEWANARPQTFLYAKLLVSAERAHTAGATLDAMRLYEQAIHVAHDNGFIHGEALAYEHAAAVYAELGLRTFADLYVREARRCYAAWGARAKVNALDAQRPDTVVAPAHDDGLGLLRSSQVISSVIMRSNLLETLVQVLLEQSGARKAAFLSVRGERWAIERMVGPDGVPATIVDHVLRTRERVLLHDATLPGPYDTDPYVATSGPRSLLCLPVVRHSDLLGIVYLENAEVPGAFTDDRLAVLELLVEQAGISLENAQLYADRGREISERQQVEATLRSVLDNMVDAVYVCDRSARITFINPAGARLLGLRPGEMPVVDELARRLGAMHPEGSSFALNELPLLRALAGEVVSSIDMTVRDLRTERVIHLRVSAAPIQDERGAIVGAVAVAINVTETVELVRLKDQFVRVVAHELKTPISIVKGYADVLRRMAHIPDDQRRLFEALVRGSDRIDRLVTDLMILWQLQTGLLGLAIEAGVNLVEVVELAVSRLAPEAARRISVERTRPLIIAADRELLDKVVSNLIDNAVRYSPGGEPITIQVVVREDRAAVAVVDRGIGIPHDKQAHLFEPFVRAHTDTPFDSGGIGLGLYVAKAIVSLHSGTIVVQSDEGRGSTFTFTLPLRRSEAANRSR